jgi:hypothetical protein
LTNKFFFIKIKLTPKKKKKKKKKKKASVRRFKDKFVRS